MTRMVTHERVAAAWRFGRSAVSDSLITDGRRLFTYGHRLGTTSDDGRKLAYCCHASQSSSVHSGVAISEADVVEECPDHGRPDLHHFKRDGVHVEETRKRDQIDYGPADLCVGGYGVASACWADHPKAICVYRCLRCDLWHPNLDDKSFRYGGAINDRRHPVSRGDHATDTTDHQPRHDCFACGSRVSYAIATGIHKDFYDAPRRKEAWQDWVPAYRAAIGQPWPHIPAYNAGTWNPDEWRYTFIDGKPVICRVCHGRASAAADAAVKS